MTIATEERVRRLADSAWLLLVSRLIAPLAVPALIGMFIWMWDTDREVALNTANIEARMMRDREFQDRMVAVEANRFTGIDGARLEARIDASYDRLADQINQLREDIRAERRANQ